MAVAELQPSQYDKRQVSYVDPMRLQHNGVVVGQSTDGNWYYVQSSNPKAPPKKWHFKVSAEMITGLLIN